MQKKVLSEIDIYTGSVDCPKNFEIDRKTIKNSILQSYATDRRSSNNSRDYYLDYFVPHSKPLGWLHDYIRDHFNCDYNKGLLHKAQWGNIYKHNQQSFLRTTVEPLDLRNSPDYTFVYAVDIGQDSCDIIIEYNDNRRADRTWNVSMKNNHFIMFPSTQKYFITPNQSKQLNIFLTISYEFI